MPYGYGNAHNGADAYPNGPPHYRQIPQTAGYGGNYDGVQYRHPGQTLQYLYQQPPAAQNTRPAAQHHQPYTQNPYSPDPPHHYHPAPYEDNTFTPHPQQYRPQQDPPRPPIQQHNPSSRHVPVSPQWPNYPHPSQQNNVASSVGQGQVSPQNYTQQYQLPHSQQRQYSGSGSPSAQLQAPVWSHQQPQLGPAHPSAQTQQKARIRQDQVQPPTTPQPTPPQQTSQTWRSGSRPQQQTPHQLLQSSASRSQPGSMPVQASNVVQRTSDQQMLPRQASATAVEMPTTIDPNVLQRRAAYVEIPIQCVSAKVEESKMPRSPKRRKSNEGEALPVCKPTSTPQRQGFSKPQKKAAPSSSSSIEPRSSELPSTPTPANVDYQAVLLGLSDEYISAAYSMSGNLTAEVSEADLDQYYALLSTGMGCLDSVLKNYHISDSRKEACIRLRFACLLYEETDNDMNAEEVLIKGLAVCERARLSELKYAMHHLMVRLWFKGGRTKTAIKAVEKNIAEVEKLNMLHWAYAFRFLRVSLGLRAGNTSVETAALVKQLSAISDLAGQHRHVAVGFVASTFEALVHLRSRTPDSIDLAQRALASGRTHQLSAELGRLPQVKLLVDCIDLGCSLARFRHDQVVVKTEAMQKNMDGLMQEPGWDEDGRWAMPLGIPTPSSMDTETDSAGVFKRLDHGEFALTFRWLTKTQVITLGFLLSGLAGIHKNASHDQKAERFLQEGFKMAKSPLDPVQQSMAAASARNDQQKLTRVIMRLYVVFAACGRADWGRSLKDISNIRKDVLELECQPDESILSLTSYLEAISKHGNGDLQGALQLYRSRQLKLNFDGEPKPPAGSLHPIRVLAALNSILIMRLNGQGAAAETLLYDLKPHCLTVKNSNGNEYGSKAVESVFFILKATEPNDATTENPIIKTKTFLQSAVSAAKSAVNNQLLCVVMNVMTDSFFRNIVGDQAEKSARTGRGLARKSQDPLWTAVSDGMFMDTLARCGKKEEAAQAKHEAQEALERLPESLKAALMSGDMHG